MDAVIKSFEKYIYDTLGLSVPHCHPVEAVSLPFFMLDEYDFYTTRIVHKECTILVSKTDREISPAQVKKHTGLVREEVSEDVVFVHPSISSYNRKRLIEYKIPFVIPGNQMYLPELMIDLREHFYSVRSSKPTFSPSTQLFIPRYRPYLLRFFSSTGLFWLIMSFSLSFWLLRPIRQLTFSRYLCITTET